MWNLIRAFDPGGSPTFVNWLDYGLNSITVHRLSDDSRHLSGSIGSSRTAPSTCLWVCSVPCKTLHSSEHNVHVLRTPPNCAQNTA